MARGPGTHPGLAQIGLETENHEKPNLEERIEVCRTHLERSIDWKGERTGLLEMRKHYADYFKGYPNFKQFRTQLVTLNSFEEVQGVLKEIAVYYDGYKPIESTDLPEVDCA